MAMMQGFPQAQGKGMGAGMGMGVGMANFGMAQYSPAQMMQWQMQMASMFPMMMGQQMQMPPAMTPPPMMQQMQFGAGAGAQGNSPVLGGRGKASAPAPPPAPADKPRKAPLAFAVLPSEAGPVLAPEEKVDELLQMDWIRFEQMAEKARSGQESAQTYEGELNRLASSFANVDVAAQKGGCMVVFVPVSCGSSGEAAVRKVAADGGRGYLIGTKHPRHEEVNRLGAVAILRFPILGLFEDGGSGEPAAKRPRKDAGQPEDPQQELRRMLKGLGKAESLKDKSSIPKAAKALREGLMEQLGARTVFTAFADMFIAAKGVAHRKAMVYVVHELLMRKGGECMRVEGRRAGCVQHFFLRVGSLIRGYKADEREAYCKIATAWQQAEVLLPAELAQLKDAWDLD